MDAMSRVCECVCLCYTISNIYTHIPREVVCCAPRNKWNNKTIKDDCKASRVSFILFLPDIHDKISSFNTTKSYVDVIKFSQILKDNKNYIYYKYRWISEFQTFTLSLSRLYYHTIISYSKRWKIFLISYVFKFCSVVIDNVLYHIFYSCFTVGYNDNFLPNNKKQTLCFEYFELRYKNL